MKIKNIYKNVYCLQGARSSNIYFFDCTKKAIIDTGHNDEKEQNYQAFIDSGLNLDNLSFIINTHSHGDHNGGNSFFKSKFPNAKIVGSNETASFQKKRRSINIMKEVEDEFEPYDIDWFVNDGDEIELGEITLKVIKTIGHTADSLAFYDEENEMLFSGDLVYNRVVTQLDYYQNLGLSITQLRESYKKIVELNPKVIWTGHGEPIENPVENFNFLFKKLNRFERDNELILINNIVPTAEFYINRNPGCTKRELENILLTNLFKFKNEPFLLNFDEGNFNKIVEKVLALMRVLNIFREENGQFFLNNRVNEYIGIKKN